MKEQDVVRRLQKEPLLNPSPPPVKTQKPEPKDLTASLMENNLSQITISKQTSTPMQQPWHPSVQPQIISNAQWPQQITTVTPQQQPQSLMQQWQQAPSLQWHTNAPSVNNSIPNWQTNGSSTNNWSSSVNQLQNISSVNCKPMSMPPPLISSSNQINNNSFQQPIKQLSSSEINDLLS